MISFLPPILRLQIQALNRSDRVIVRGININVQDSVLMILPKKKRGKDKSGSKRVHRYIRYIEFNRINAYICKGKNGRLGRNSCEYFNVNGESLK